MACRLCLKYSTRFSCRSNFWPSFTSTYFYVDGKQISAEKLLQKLFDTLRLPSLFNNEKKLREICKNPLTRRDLMSNLEKEEWVLD